MLFINPNAGSNQNIPNIALGYAATYYGNTRVLDLNIRPLPERRYLDTETDILGISVQSRTLSRAKAIRAEYLAKYPQAKVKSVTGFLDIQCCYAFLELDEDLKYSGTFSDDLPFPNYELFDSFEMFKHNWQKGKWNYSIMTSLGCPFGCIFCSSHKRKWNARSAGNCYQELKQAKQRWGIRSFSVLDDCFNLNKERAYDFCRLVQSLNLSWACANGLRADLFDEKLAGALAAAGCRHVSFGVESTSPQVLENINKGERFEQIETAINLAQKHGLSVAGFFILGLPGSAYEIDLSSLTWAIRKNITPHFSFYIPEAQKPDSIFCGESAGPRSTVYPPALQQKIYDLARSFNDEKASGLKNAISRLNITLRHDPMNLPAQMAGLSKRIVGRALRLGV